MKLRVCFVVVAFVGFLVGCGGEKGMGHVSGKVTVDGQVPAVGSSITFFPSDGKQSAGAMLKDGLYSVDVPIGESRVEIRIPRPVANGPAQPKEGPGSGPGPGGDGGGYITESLPKKYNDESTLTLKVESGSNTKDWEVSTTP